eukprot:3790744-Amphidinium_carterae.1
MNRVGSLGLPATSKARIVKSLFSVGLYGAEVGGMSVSQRNDVRISARSWRMGGTAAHGPLEPDDTWLQWANFANKVLHSWRLNRWSSLLRPVCVERRSRRCPDETENENTFVIIKWNPTCIIPPYEDFCEDSLRWLASISTSNCSYLTSADQGRIPQSNGEGMGESKPTTP